MKFVRPVLLKPPAIPANEPAMQLTVPLAVLPYTDELDPAAALLPNSITLGFVFVAETNLSFFAINKTFMLCNYNI